MQFRIADTFTDSLARLTCQEQRVVEVINHRDDEEMKVLEVD